MGCMVLEISVLIPFVQRPTIDAFDDVSSKDNCLNFDLRLHLHPYFVSAQD